MPLDPSAFSTPEDQPVFPWFLAAWPRLKPLAVFLHLFAAPLCVFMIVRTNVGEDEAVSALENWTSGRESAVRPNMLRCRRRR